MNLFSLSLLVLSVMILSAHNLFMRGKYSQHKIVVSKLKRSSNDDELFSTGFIESESVSFDAASASFGSVIANIDGTNYRVREYSNQFVVTLCNSYRAHVTHFVEPKLVNLMSQFYASDESKNNVLALIGEHIKSPKLSSTPSDSNESDVIPFKRKSKRNRNRFQENFNE